MTNDPLLTMILVYTPDGRLIDAGTGKAIAENVSEEFRPLLSLSPQLYAMTYRSRKTYSDLAQHFDDGGNLILANELHNWGAACDALVKMSKKNIFGD